MTSPPPKKPPAGGRTGHFDGEGTTTTTPPTPTPDSARDHGAGRRAREVYSIFHPQSLISPIEEEAEPTSRLPPGQSTPSTPHHGGGSSQRYSSVASPAGSPHLHAVDTEYTVPLVLEPHLSHHNETLTSFAQLAALRLDVERVLISVSDQDSQFIIAQAAQTNQGDLDLQDLGDGVWNGNSRLSLDEWIMCRDTLDLPPSNREKGTSSFIEVNDLSIDERYKNLPFVRGDPGFRFYAGTPLTADKKINIGSIFVLDKKPHPTGLTGVEKNALVTVGALVSEYLAVSRQATDGRRAARLSRALNYFVEGSSEIGERASTAPSTPAAVGTASISWSPPPPTLSNRSALRSAESPSVKNSETRSHRSRSSRGTWSQGLRSSGARSTSRDRRGGSAASRSETSTNRTPETSSSGDSWMFQRAANLIRQSLELGTDGGVIFLRADPHLLHEAKWRSSNNIGEKAPREPTLPHVLAASTAHEPFAARPGSETTTPYPAAELNVEFLHQLLDRYRHGRLWSFHRDGLLSSSDDDRPSPARTDSQQSIDESRVQKASENSTLNRYFPGATQVLFVPLWNAADSQWFAGCFCWNTLETRVFNPTVELSSMLGFGSSIMAEYIRMQSVAADRQKSHFIGSISHELRSPLHGIMAAGEFLQGTRLDEFQRSLLDTISKCGRTLLDTMNQVLDYSKTVSSERGRAHAKRRSAKQTNSGASSLLDTSVATDLSALAEEVVEGVYLGHAYGQRSTAPSDCPENMAQKSLVDASQPTQEKLAVEVVLDIAQHNWVYQTHPGALRRIIMNLVGNALKYTEAGKVSLEMDVIEAAPRKAGGPAAKPGEALVLRVSDTGKGISEEFLRNRLYTPFAQEDPLAVGTGLGLSIVRSLLKSLDGDITFDSRAGEGTSVKVTMPLTRPGLEDASLDRDLQNLTIQGSKSSGPISKHAGRRASILLEGDAEDISSSPRWTIISRYLVGWFGIELVPHDSNSPVDFMLVDGTTTVPIETETVLPPILVVWDPSASPSNPLPGWLSSAPTVNFVRLPCGPWKLAAAIERCLNQQSETTSVALQSRTSPVAHDDQHPAAAAAAPQSQPSLCPQCQSASTQQDAAIERTARGPRVLVVEDNPINRNLILTFLKKRNLAALESADNGKRAVEAVEQEKHGYDLIFMDISMPVMNGFEATRAIRALERERDGGVSAKIIALTGLSSAQDETEALNSGMDMFVTKPFSFEKLSEYLKKWEQNEL
ncbi:hybrid sensor histidine kinase/response regulator [Aspergillus brunneoviolaceus CBS 621.78]|uniref:Uncharacterized protein n=1 Tax=Aspergillus brunneoviolaceus CBS 621.78 TaxID=1450534 RepID=A0ACD1GEK1_9EURO|nr:hypothetical protein BO95DRAFT_480682 [Aspergillus brunneoviolaceus CBS 621.78]RAH47724.1 hypothetical protein BO95DRAFT_480682 [Aspergillus brunneoviolaceus CBS 621.78]